MDNKQLFQERSKRMEDVVNGILPDRVPIYSLIDNWAFPYVGITAYEASEDWEAMYQAFKRVATDFIFDSVFCATTSKCMKYNGLLGGGRFQFVNGIMEINTTNITSMSPEEYPQLIADPYKFFAEKLGPRRFEFLRSDDMGERARILTEAVKVNNAYRAFSGQATKRLADETGMPVSRIGGFLHPLDIILDFLRNMDGTLVDLRRHPQQVYEACEALNKITLDMIIVPGRKHVPGTSLFNALHTPPFIGRKQFDKFYAPFYLQIMNAINDNGEKCMCYYEKNYSHLYDALRDTPKDTVIGFFEDDDMNVVKRELGDMMCVGGGMDVLLLGKGTKEQCLDAAKRAIDNLAPGGRYIFTTNKIPNSLIDANPENLKAVNEFVCEYGKY